MVLVRHENPSCNCIKWPQDVTISSVNHPPAPQMKVKNKDILVNNIIIIIKLT